MSVKGLTASYSNPALRKFQEAGTVLTPANFMFPVFVSDESPTLRREIPSLPGQYHFGTESLVEYLRPLMAKGLTSVLVFGVPTRQTKDDEGTIADSDGNPAVQAIKALKKAFGDRLLVAADVCLCAYTSHGHCGVLTQEGRINFPPSVLRIASVALTYAKAGADVVAPSDMMEGRVGAIKRALADGGFGHVPCLSYAAKFASCLYGPFRGACSTNLKGDRQSYQLPPGAQKLALRAVEQDVQHGADFVMVKPGLAYLDIIADCKRRFDVPVAVYHVSGEYAMLYYAAKHGALDLRSAVMEVMVSFRRAGADIIASYYTPQILEWLAQGSNAKL